MSSEPAPIAPPQPSPVSAIRPREEEIVALPEKLADGTVLWIRIRQCYVSDAYVGSEAMHALAEMPPEKRKRAKLTAPQTRQFMRRMAELGIVEPPFSFDVREPGKAFWDDLSTGNQTGALSAIFRLSKLPMFSPEAEGKEGAASRLASFPGERATGLVDGGGPAGDVDGTAQAAAPRRRSRRRQ